jgi:hypothetical protein
MLSGLVTSGLLCFTSITCGPVAQRLEQGTHNPLVPGSNPGGPSFISEFSFQGSVFRIKPWNANFFSTHRRWSVDRD